MWRCGGNGVVVRVGRARGVTVRNAGAALEGRGLRAAIRGGARTASGFLPPAL